MLNAFSCVQSTHVVGYEIHTKSGCIERKIGAKLFVNLKSHRKKNFDRNVDESRELPCNVTNNDNTKKGGTGYARICMIELSCLNSYRP